MATQSKLGAKTAPVQTGGKNAKGGKTNEDMLKLGRGLAKVANQKRG